MVKIITGKKTMVKLLTTSKKNLVKINTSEIIMAKPTMAKFTIILN
jgi:hypothetical protein